MSSNLYLYLHPVLSFLQDAKEKFQHLQKVISILGDEEKRALYDQTGCVDDAVSAYKTYSLSVFGWIM